jgi:hypothetical protein
MADKTPAPRTKTDRAVSEKSSVSDIESFLKRTRSVPPGGGQGRLIFAMDATMSRQPSWDTACQIQGEMFSAVGGVGSLDVQLVYFRGIGECAASKWVGDPVALGSLMSRISCRGGHTQIGKVLSHARREATAGKVSAMIYVGDCMEEDVDDLCAKAGELGLLGIPAFVFQEGQDMHAERTFREIARLTGGAYCQFDSGSAKLLTELLRAVAVYATGGRKALADQCGGAGARLLLQQME